MGIINIAKQSPNSSGCALILEDDVALHAVPQQEAALSAALGKLARGVDEWDVAFLCHFPRHRLQGRYARNVVHAKRWEGPMEGPAFTWCLAWHVLYGYAVSTSGAQKLLRHALPIYKPVDVHIGEQARLGRLKVLRLETPIAKTVKAGSDTEGIL